MSACHRGILSLFDIKDIINNRDALEIKYSLYAIDIKSIRGIISLININDIKDIINNTRMESTRNTPVWLT
jgi:hypothetical protein